MQDSVPAYFVVTRDMANDIARISLLDEGLAPTDVSIEAPGLRDAVYLDGKLAVLAETSDDHGNFGVHVTLYDTKLAAISAPTRISDPFKMTSVPWHALYFRDGGAKLAVLRMYSDPSSVLSSTVPYLRSLDCSAPDATDVLPNSSDPLARLPWGIGHILDLNRATDSVVYSMGLNRDKLYVVSLATNTKREVITDPEYRQTSLVGSAAIASGTMMIMANADVWYVDTSSLAVVGKALPGFKSAGRRVARGSAVLRSDGRAIVVVEERLSPGKSRLSGYDAETLVPEWEVAAMPSPRGWRVCNDALVVCWWSNPGQILLLKDAVAIATQSSVGVEDVIPIE
ncbi:MAG: hypothetical protein ACKVWV_13960 [Planctomycetota bacterium]